MSVILPWLISFWIANIHISCWAHPSTLRRSNIYSYILSDCQSWFFPSLFSLNAYFLPTVIELHSLFWKTPKSSGLVTERNVDCNCLQQTTSAPVPNFTPYRNRFIIQPLNNLLTWLDIQDLYIFRGLWMTHAIMHLSFFGYGASGSNTDVRWIWIFTCKWSLWHLLPVISYCWVMFALFSNLLLIFKWQSRSILSTSSIHLTSL